MSEKKEPPKPKPVSPTPEGIRVTPLPEELTFHIDDKGRVWASIRELGDKKFPLDSDLVKSIMFTTMMKAKKAMPSKDDMESYYHRARKQALDNFRKREDLEAILLESNTVVWSMLVMMHSWTHADDVPEDQQYEWVGSQTNLRKKLEEICKEMPWPYKHWPKANWFSVYLADQIARLKEHNLELKFLKPVNYMRPVSLKWIDTKLIPPWNGLVIKPQ